MSSTGKTSRLLLSQFQGTDKPSWLADYNADMAAIDSFAATGWVPLPATYASATSFTLPGDWHTLLERGTKIKVTQGTDKYLYVYPDATYSSATGLTTVPLIGGTNFSLSNTAISSAYFSKGNGIGHPDWLDWSPTFGASGGMTYTSITKTAKFKIAGRECRGFVDAQGTAGGTASSTLSFTPPVTPNPLLSYSGDGYIYDGSNYVLSSVFFNTTSFSVVKYNLANIVLGAGVIIRVKFSFPI